MITSIPEENTPAAAINVKRKPSKKATAAKRPRHVAPTKSRAADKATGAKKAPKARAKTEPAQPKVAREGSKTAKIVELLKRPGGATSKQLMKATGWLPHSVRGFLSGTLRKKMGLAVTSAKNEDGERTYSIEA